MARRLCILAFLLFGTEADTHAGQPAVIVISVHDDPAVAGPLQQRFEARVGVAPELRLRPSTEVASLHAERSKANSTSSIRAILDRAREAYWRDHTSVVEECVGEAAALLERMGPFPPFDSAEISMWQIALLAKKDEILAQREAGKLLAVAPDIQVDLDVFPPSLSTLIEGVRRAQPRAVTVEVSGLPHGAIAWIDGRPASHRSLVIPGSHRLHIEGPGFRSVDRAFEATGDVTLSAGLAPALPSELGSVLIAYALGKELNDKELTAVWELLFRAKADAIAVVARADGGLRARIFRGRSSTAPSGTVAFTSDGEKSLAEWIVTSIIQTPQTSTKPTTPAGAAARRSPNGFALQGGLAAMTSSWRVSNADGGRFVARFSGGGPSLAAQSRSHNVIAELRVVFVDFGSRERSFDVGDGSQASAGGGSTASVRLGSGYRFAWSRKDTAPSLTGFAGGSFDRHLAGPLRDSTGDLHLLPSWQRFCVELGVRGELPVVVSASVRPSVVRLQASGTPWGDWRTTPADALGSPRPFTALSWGAVADVGLPHQWALVLEYLGSASTVSFDGVGSAPVDPQLRRATAVERTDTLQLLLGKEF